MKMACVHLRIIINESKPFDITSLLYYFFLNLVNILIIAAETRLSSVEDLLCKINKAGEYYVIRRIR